MKTLLSRLYLFCALVLSALVGQAAPLGTAFTYQGRLHDGSQPATGIYDLRFTLYDTVSGAGAVGNSLTNAATPVINGMFAMSLDFGASAFDGDARWLAIEVRTNGGSAFFPLTPRQPLSPAPNAIYATKASTVAAGSVGTAGLAAGAVDSSRIADGTIGTADLGPAVLSNTFWRLGGNTATTPGTQFLGTTDNQSLEFKANGQRALRLEPGTGGLPNIIGGASVNTVDPGVFGAVIGGGGAAAWPNRVAANNGTIAGGIGHQINDGANDATIGGGALNTIESSAADTAISGGRGNRIQSGAVYAAIGGGVNNTNGPSAIGATIPGGRDNYAGGLASFAAGRRAKALSSGTFVWADYTDADFASTGANQFLIRASGGVGIGTNNPQAALHVAGSVLASNFVGSGTGLTALSGSALADSSISAAKFAPGAVNHLDAPDGSPLNAVQVNTSGLVGIGANAPQAGLDIQTSSTVTASRVLFEVDLFSSDTYTNIGNVHSVSVAGNLVALGAMSDGVTLVDVADPQAPVIRWQVRDGVGVFTNIGQVGAVALRSNLLAIASWTADALTLVDISNPTNPVKVAELRDGVNGWNDLAWEEAVVMSGNLLAVASRSESAVTLADISVPANPVRRYVFKQGVNSYTNVAGPMAVAISGNLLAIGSWSNSAVTLVDVSTPASPVKRAELVNGLGGFTNLGGVQGLAFSGNLLAIAAAQGNAVTLVDVSNPSAPTLKSVIRNGADGVTTLGEPRGVALANNRLVVTGFSSNAVTLFDIADVAQPRLLGAARNRIGGADYLAGAWGVAFVGSNVAVAAYYSSAFTMLEFAPQPAGLVSQGWVGIGTRDPDAPLHVVGNVLIEQAQFFNVNANRLALGTDNQTSGRDSIAIGHQNTASGWDSVALGSASEASGWGAMAFGTARARGDFSVALGSSATAGDWFSMAFGAHASAGAANAVALGVYCNALGDSSTAIGYGAVATGDGAVALGTSTQATNAYSTTLGRWTVSGGYASTAMGLSTKAFGAQSTAMGNDTTAGGALSLAAGYRARATNEGAFVWADSTEADFGSTGQDQFLIRAAGGVGINTNNPNGAALNVLGAVRASAFQGNGAGLTGVSGDSITTGTIAEIRLSDNVARRSGGNLISGPQIFTSGYLRMGDQEIFLRDSNDANSGLGWYGDRSGSAGNKHFGGYTVNGPVLYGAENGALGTRSNIASGNIALFWTAAGNVGIGGIPQDARLDVLGNLRLNQNDLFLREGSDRNHGLGWYGANKLFGGVNVDGPVLYGWSGGGVGTMNGGPRLALQWDAVGTVAIDSGNLNAGTPASGLKFGGLYSGEGIASKRTGGGNLFALDFYTGSSNRMTILNTGDIGIGTLSPTRRLHIMDGSGPAHAGGSIQVGMATTGGDPKLVYFGDGDYVHIGENGQDDTMELKASRFYFAGGNLGIDTNNPAYKIHLAGGAYCTGSQWVNASDRDRKESFQTINNDEVLRRVAALPLATWSYKDDPASRHLGPTAQDFHAAFGFGSDDKAIGTVDADGVALAAIQGLNQKLEAEVKSKDARIRELEQRLTKLEHLLSPQNGGVR